MPDPAESQFSTPHLPPAMRGRATPDFRSLRLSGFLRKCLIFSGLIGFQLTSLRPLMKFSSGHQAAVVPLYLIAVATFYLLLVFYWKRVPFLRKLLETRPIYLILIILITCTNCICYPKIDARKQVMQGSDQDDALVMTAKHLVRGEYPWKEKSYLGNPISSGPGIILAAMPFSLTNYALLTPFFLGLLAAAIRFVLKSMVSTNILFLLLVSHLSFWEMTVAGSDLLAVGILATLALLATFCLWNRSFLHNGVALVITVLFSTTRVVFLYFPIVIGVLLRSRSLRQSFSFSTLATALSVLLVFACYCWDPPHFAPLHLLRKGPHLLGPVTKVILIVSCLGVGLLACLRKQDNLRSWLLYGWLSLFTPLVFTSLSALFITRHGDLAHWEEANYLSVTLLLFLTSATFEILEPDQR